MKIKTKTPASETETKGIFAVINDFGKGDYIEVKKNGKRITIENVDSIHITVCVIDDTLPEQTLHVLI